jgi:hypothetical protein
LRSTALWHDPRRAVRRARRPEETE